MGLAYRGEYANPFSVELELERLDSRIVTWPKKLTTEQRDGWDGVPEGTVVYNLTTHKLNVYTGSAWEVVTSS